MKQAQTHGHTYTKLAIQTDGWKGWPGIRLDLIILSLSDSPIGVVSQKHTRAHTHTHTHTNCCADSLFSAVLSASRGDGTVRGRKLVGRYGKGSEDGRKRKDMADYPPNPTVPLWGYSTVGTCFSLSLSSGSTFSTSQLCLRCFFLLKCLLPLFVWCVLWSLM